MTIYRNGFVTVPFKQTLVPPTYWLCRFTQAFYQSQYKRFRSKQTV